MEVVNEESCRINKLPDLLLLHILTFLPIKAAVRTSVLSSRWRHLCTALPSVNFDVADFSESTSLQDATDLFMVVTRFLLNHSSLLNSFRLDVILKNDLATTLLGDWIRHVFGVKKVKEFCLKVRFTDDPGRCYDLCLHRLDCASIESLKLTRCAFDSPQRSPVVLPILKSLSIHNICLDQSTLSEMVVSCPCLESLSLKSFSGTSEEMQISAPRLKNLDIVYSDFVDLEIVATSVLSFKFDCFSELDGKSCVRKLDIDVSRLKVLKACSCAFEALHKHNNTNERPHFSELQRIVVHPCSKKLHLEVVASVLGSDPTCLQRLYIDNQKGCLSFHHPTTHAQSVLLQRLQSVSIGSFSGALDELELVKHILKEAPLLESMGIRIDQMEKSRWVVTTRELLCQQRLFPKVNIDFYLIEG